MERSPLAYELMYIVRPTVDEQTLASVNQKVDAFITSNGGAIARRDDWGKRRLAFPINKFTEGFYAVVTFNFAATEVRDLERALKLTEDVLRYIVVRLDEA